MPMDPRTTRRDLLLSGAATALAAAVAPGLARSAAAAVPPAGAQAPGYYRLRVGGLEVTALLDGHLEIPPAMFSLPAADADRAAARRLPTRRPDPHARQRVRRQHRRAALPRRFRHRARLRARRRPSAGGAGRGRPAARGRGRGDPHPSSCRPCRRPRPRRQGRLPERADRRRRRRGRVLARRGDRGQGARRRQAVLRHRPGLARALWRPGHPAERRARPRRRPASR